MQFVDQLQLYFFCNKDYSIFSEESDPFNINVTYYIYFYSFLVDGYIS